MAPTHGKSSTYKRGCRCSACRQAATDYKRQRRAAKAASVHADEKPCEVCGSPMHRRGSEYPTEFRARRTCSKDCAKKLQVGARWASDPQAVGGRTLLARTCPDCGDLLPGYRFPRDVRRGSRARVCRACQQRAYRSQLSDDALAAYRMSSSRATARLQADTLPTAVRWGQQWTGPELEIVATRADLNTSQIAAMLGRSYRAVITARHNLQVDPRKERLAGARAHNASGTHGE